MKKAVLAFFTLLWSFNGFPQTADIGIGLILGKPTGVSVKMWTSENTAIVASLGYDMGYLDNLYLSADFHIHNWFFEMAGNQAKVYLGPGAGLGFTSEISISIRAPGGMGYYFRDIPFEIFAELAPVLQIFGGGFDIQFWIGGYIGARWYF